MKSLEELGQVITTDVLVIGGGLSGLLSGIKAREKPVDVLVVDKGGIGWIGQVPITGAVCAVIRPEQAEEWFKWGVTVGQYLNNQDWTHFYATEIYNAVMETAKLGVPFLKTDGEVAITPFQKNFTATRFNPRKCMIKLKQAAVSRGVKTLDKIYIVDLLLRDGKVGGAIGFGLVDGKTYVLKAKATIIASGGCMSQHHRHFAMNTGEGVAMAYRAGAQLMSAEFVGGYGFAFKAGGIRRRNPLYLFYENARGERFMGNYYPELRLGQKRAEDFEENFYQIADAMSREVAAGRGPIYLDFRKFTPEESEIAFRDEIVPIEVQPAGRGGSLLEYLRKRTGVDATKERVEVVPYRGGGMGPVRIGLDCQTTVEGLWAVGDTSWVGSSWAGAIAGGTFPGYGIGFAMVSGLKAGQVAREYAATGGKVNVEYGEVKRIKERMLAPIGRDGTVRTHEVIYQIQETVVPVKYFLFREAERLKETLGKLEVAKQNLPRVGAKDYHELYRYHQAASMAANAEWTLKAALMREESRGTHHREDYPYRDDKNWLRWIVIKEEEGVPKFFTEPVPIERYRLPVPKI